MSYPRGGAVTFEEFAAGHLAAARRFAAVLIGDQTWGDDLVQEVLVRAHARWRRIGSMDRPEFYVRKMIVNEFLSSRRRTWWLVPAGSGTDIDQRVTPDHATSQADRDALLTELGKLPAQQRAVLVLRYYEGLSDGRIAELLGLPLDAVNVKAKTGEGVGLIGRAEAMSCQAVALIEERINT